MGQGSHCGPRRAMAQAAAQDCRAAVVSAMPIPKRFATMCFDRGALRYAARYGDRYVVDLQGSFAEYIKKFSKKSRGNLQRAAKKFEKGTDSIGPILEFRSPSEIVAFRDIAVAISRASYKGDLGWGFQEDKGFARQIELDAVVTASIINKRLSVLACFDSDLCGIQIEITAEYAPNQKPAFAESLAISRILQITRNDFDTIRNLAQQG